MQLFHHYLPAAKKLTLTRGSQSKVEANKCVHNAQSHKGKSTQEHTKYCTLWHPHSIALLKVFMYLIHNSMCALASICCTLFQTNYCTQNIAQSAAKESTLIVPDLQFAAAFFKWLSPTKNMWPKSALGKNAKTRMEKLGMLFGILSCQLGLAPWLKLFQLSGFQSAT